MRHRSTSTCTGARASFSPAYASALRLFCMGGAGLGSSSEQMLAVMLDHVVQKSWWEFWRKSST